MNLRFGRQLCGALEESSTREWLLADGTGGYAMGTVAGLRTRRYHGLLVVATEPPGGRMLALAALDPVLVLAPVLTLCAGTLVMLRVLPLAARLGDRAAARRRGLTLAVAAWQMSRRPLRQAGPVLLAVLAVVMLALTLTVSPFQIN